MPCPSCHCSAICLLAVIHLRPFRWRVAKLHRTINWFIWVSIGFWFFALCKSSLTCSRSSCHPQISLLSFSVIIGLSSSVSRRNSVSLSSLSKSYPSSSSPPAALDDTSSHGKPDGTGAHNGSHKVACAEEDSGNGVIDGAQDGALDS